MFGVPPQYVMPTALVAQEKQGPLKSHSPTFIGLGREKLERALNESRPEVDSWIILC